MTAAAEARGSCGRCTRSCSANPPLRSPASPPRWRRSPSLPPPLPQQPAAIRPQAPAPAPPSAWSTRSSPARSAACTAAPTPGTSRSPPPASRSPASEPSTRPCKGRFWIAGAPTASRSQGLYLDGTNRDDAAVADRQRRQRHLPAQRRHQQPPLDLLRPRPPGLGSRRRHPHRAQPHPRLRPPARPPTTTTASTSRLATDTLIRGNWIYDNADRGIQLYPNAQNSHDRGQRDRRQRRGHHLLRRVRRGLERQHRRGQRDHQQQASATTSRAGSRAATRSARGNVVRNNCIKGGVYDRGNGGIGDQWGFRVVGTCARGRPMRTVRARTSGSPQGSACRVGMAVAYRNTVPGPEGLREAHAAERDDFPPRDLRSGPPDRPPRPPPALHRPGRERAPGTARGRSSPAATATDAGWPGSRSAPTEPSPCARACARRARPASSASEPWYAESDSSRADSGCS